MVVVVVDQVEVRVDDPLVDRVVDEEVNLVVDLVEHG